jgi:phosphoesterase RecJ-like protein
MVKRVRKIIILTHRNGDPDAICSAFALKRLLKSLNPGLEVVVGTPEGVNKLSEKILSRFEVKVESNLQLQDFDIIFMVDTNSPLHLGKLGTTIKSLEKPVAIIDHHYPNESIKGFPHIEYCNEKSPSTCEIVYELYRQSKVECPRREASMLLVGIVCETRYLRLATSKTLLVVAELIERGAQIEELYSLLEVPMDDSERMARLKAAQRCNTLRLGEWIVVTSNVGSHQASAARALIMLGADLAIVGGDDKDQLKLSLRSTKEFHQKTGIHLGRDLARPLGESFDGSGGGHSLAAGVSCSGRLEPALKKCVDFIRDLMRKAQKPTRIRSRAEEGITQSTASETRSLECKRNDNNQHA